MAGDHIAVTAVVALAAHNQDRISLQVETHQDLGGAPASILHQHDAGYAEFLDRSAIEFADLGSGQCDHGRSRSNVIPLVSTCN